jgi:hypothetical protein
MACLYTVLSAVLLSGVLLCVRGNSYVRLHVGGAAEVQPLAVTRPRVGER